MEKFHFEYERTPITINTHSRPDRLFDHFTQTKTFYELDLLEIARKIYRPGSWIIDAGANIGNHTIFFSKIISASVMAFEPFPKNHELLVANLEANGCRDNVLVSNHALGSSSERGRAHSGNPANLGMVSVASDIMGDITMSRLDDLVTSEMDISIIKIDVEGAELAVLEGASKTLAACRPHVFAEAAEKNEFETIRSFLSRFGYSLAGRYAVTPTYLFSRDVIPSPESNKT